MSEPWLNFAVALALGLLIGIDRERRKGAGVRRGAAGIRTFGLSTLLGAVAFHVGASPALLIATSGVVILAALSYFRDRGDDPGLTTEIALMASPFIGALAMTDMIMAGVLGVAIAVVLAAKASVHRVVTGVLSNDEINDGLVFAIATVVVWPQLPNRAMGPYDALNPHAIWLFVVLVLAIAASGHVLTRLLGSRFGLPLAGLASGFVSSTATVGSMASRAAKTPGDLKAAVAGATLSTVATFVQLGLLLSAASRPTLIAIALPLLAGGAVALAYGGAFTVLAVRSSSGQAQTAGRAFSVRTALVLAATLTVMLVISAWLRATFGETGIVLGAAVGGLVDTHAAAISLASLVASEKLTASAAVFPILAAMTTNAAAKSVMAFGAGRWPFILRVVPGLVLSTAAAWLTALPMLLQ